jgi:hypothetical protein
MPYFRLELELSPQGTTRPVGVIDDLVETVNRDLEPGISR